jgi:iron complex transport system ATP-binding protein
MADFSINIHDLSIGYKEKKHNKIIAHSLNATIPPGQLTCLIGTNGVGKSTLLRTLSAFHSPLYGEIIIGDKKLSSYSSKELSKTISIVLTEKINVYNMSVYELVSLGRSPYSGLWGKLNKKDKTIIEEAIQLVHISNLRNRAIQTLSDGERQKSMIAKTLAQQTSIIFLDEPTAFLDFQSKIEILQLLRRISKTKHRIVFFSTHDIDLALRFSDKIWFMKKGGNLIIGSPEELSKDRRMEIFSQECNTTLNNNSLLQSEA